MKEQQPRRHNRPGRNTGELMSNPPELYVLMIEDLRAETVTFGEVPFTRPMMEAMREELEGRSTKDFIIKFVPRPLTK